MVTNLFQNGNKKQLTIKSDSSSDNASDESIKQTVVQALMDMYRHFKTKKLSYMNLIRKQQFLWPLCSKSNIFHLGQKWKLMSLSTIPLKNKSL